MVNIIGDQRNANEKPKRNHYSLECLKLKRRAKSTASVGDGILIHHR